MKIGDRVRFATGGVGLEGVIIDSVYGNQHAKSLQFKVEWDCYGRKITAWSRPDEIKVL
jgi:hypothetical protein